MWRSVLDTLPRDYTLDERDWQRRHRLLLGVLAAHVPGLALFGLLLGHPPPTVAYVLVTPAACLAFGHWLRRRRRTAAVLVTAGLVYSSAALVGLTGGTIEAHFHFFIIIGFIALYQDWAPFLFNIIFTVISHGVGSAWQQTLIFNHPAAQGNPWLWSAIHGVAVLLACVGMTLFWRVTEESQREKDTLSRRLANAEISRRKFASELLVNLARRNQSMLYRQLDIINQLEESERDPDALAELFELDHLATRVRRNAESLLVLSGEQPTRTWSAPVPLRDIARAAVAEIEHLERVVLVVDERPAVSGRSVTDLTHLLAELTENAVRFSPPDTVVTIRSCPDRDTRGGHLISVEDWGFGMSREELAATNALLADPPEVDVSVAQRLGFHVVARLAARHRTRVTLTATPGSGLTAMVTLPAGLFETPLHGEPGPRRSDSRPPRAPLPRSAFEPMSVVPDADRYGPETTWPGWWAPSAGTAAAEHAPPASVAVPSPRHTTAAVPAPRRTTDPIPPAAATPPPGGPDPGFPTLRKRVPQASLAPELQDAIDWPAPLPRDAAGSPEALSRYQAGRRAALGAAETGGRT